MTSMRRAINLILIVVLVFFCKDARARDSIVGPWVTGTVRDNNDKPVAGAQVFVTTLCYDGHGKNRSLAAATTAEDGHYTVSADVGPLGSIGMLLVCKPGLVSMTSSFDVPERPQRPMRTDDFSDAAPSPTPIHDFVMTKNGGDLDVVALVDGKPAAGVPVLLERPEFDRLADGLNLEGLVSPPEMHFAEPSNRNYAKLERAIHPRAVTDQNGVAHFTCLTPGSWNLTTAVDSKVLWEKRLKNSIHNPPGEGSKWACQVGIAVRAGEFTTQRVTLYSQWNAAITRTLDLDGHPVSKIKTFPFLTNKSSGFSWNASESDENGVRTIVFQRPGIHRIEAEPADGSAGSVHCRPRSYPAAVEDVAVSSLLHLDVPPTVVVRSVNPGVLDVAVVGVDGRPLRLPVTLDIYLNSCYGQTRATDERGHARFSVVSPMQWLVFVRPPYSTEYRCNFRDLPLPRDEELKGKWFVPPVHAASRSDEQTNVSMHAVLSGYVRGRLKCPSGCKPEDYSVYPSGDEAGPQMVQYDHKTGDFVAGPFAKGRVELSIYAGQYQSLRPLMRVRTDVPDGGIVHLADIAPPLASKNDKRLPTLEEDKIQVLMADGKTPAPFARARVFEGEGETPCIDLLADATGKVNLEGDDHYWPWRGCASNRNLVVLIPGKAGAAVIDLSRRSSGPISVVLPKPVSAMGRVTVGGQSTAGLNGQLRVLAGYQDAGKLNQALSVWATPQDDGTFEVAGLTKGHYLIQAALDGIWLSYSVPVEVTDHDIPNLMLDIGQPGSPVALTVADGAGKPLIGQKVEIDRPIGPLTGLDWPADFLTDGAGVVNIPPLEVGKHKIHVGRFSTDVTARPLPCKAPVEVRCVIRPEGLK